MRSPMSSASVLLLASVASAALFAACSSPSDPPPATDAGVDGTVPDGAADATADVDASDVLPDAPTDGGDGGVPDKLSATTLYSNFAAGTISPALLEFAPAYFLWSDAALKRRWIELPPGTKIDTSNMDHWIFPIGTKFWKEFSRDGKKLETRLIQHAADKSWIMGSYIWSADQSDATWTTAGATNINGTDWDVPSLSKCQACHNAEPGRINGFEAVQLSKPGPGLNLKWLASMGMLSNPPPPGVDYPVPGDPRESLALGTLHANCGHCHNPGWEFFGLTNQVLRLNVADRTVPETTIFRSTVGQHTMSFKTIPLRIAPGDSGGSAIPFRMSHRGDAEAMPPIGTKRVDDPAIAAVRAWIDSLPKPPPPPPDAGVDDGASDATSDAIDTGP